MQICIFPPHIRVLQAVTLEEAGVIPLKSFRPPRVPFASLALLVSVMCLVW